MKFILDVHLGKLARRLRMLGFDTLYETDYDDPQIVEIALAEGRTILTRDRGLLQRRPVASGQVPGYLVQSEDAGADGLDERVREVLTHFGLVDQIAPFRRCMACNGLIEPVAKAEIVDQLEPLTAAHYDEFYQCQRCGRLYWRGSHFDKMQASIDDLRQYKV